MLHNIFRHPNPPISPISPIRPILPIPQREISTQVLSSAKTIKGDIFTRKQFHIIPHRSKINFLPILNIFSVIWKSPIRKHALFYFLLRLHFPTDLCCSSYQVSSLTWDSETVRRKARRVCSGSNFRFTWSLSNFLASGTNWIQMTERRIWSGKIIGIGIALSYTF